MQHIFLVCELIVIIHTSATFFMRVYNRIILELASNRRRVQSSSSSVRVGPGYIED